MKRTEVILQVNLKGGRQKKFLMKLKDVEFPLTIEVSVEPNSVQLDHLHRDIMELIVMGTAAMSGDATNSASHKKQNSGKGGGKFSGGQNSGKKGAGKPAASSSSTSKSGKKGEQHKGAKGAKKGKVFMK